MPQLSTLDVCRQDLFTAKAELELRYTANVVARIMRIREE